MKDNLIRQVCNVCGRDLDEVDVQEDYGIHKVMGYGTKFDGDTLDLHLCCNCMENLIDSCAVSPIPTAESKDKGEPIFLILGESGCGKDTIVNTLCDKYGYKRVKSYTTRPPRGTETDERSHIFVSDFEFDQLQNLVAYTRFDRYRYCATSEQVDNADLYIIDADGIKFFQERYKGARKPFVIRIVSTVADRYTWLYERYGADDAASELALNRIEHDELAFAKSRLPQNIGAEINNSVYKSLDTVVEEVHQVIERVRNANEFENQKD